MTTTYTPSTPIVPVTLNTLTRCGFCGCPIEAGAHVDSGRRDCGWDE